MAIINNPNEKIFAEKMFQKMVELSQKSNKGGLYSEMATASQRNQIAPWKPNFTTVNPGVASRISKKIPGIGNILTALLGGQMIGTELNERLGISDFLAEYLSPEPEYPEEQEYPYSIYEKNEDARYRNKNNTSSRGQLLNEMKRQTKYKENFREKLSKRGK
jgi:hypothetical protein